MNKIPIMSIPDRIEYCIRLINGIEAIVERSNAGKSAKECARNKCIDVRGCLAAIKKEAAA